LIRQILQEGHTQSPTGEIGCNYGAHFKIERI
jgi:hypothetical protein